MLLLERTRRAPRRRERDAWAKDEGQHEKLEPVDRAQIEERLQRALAAEKERVAFELGCPQLLEQPLRSPVRDDDVRGNVVQERLRGEHVDLLAGPTLR